MPVLGENLYFLICLFCGSVASDILGMGYRRATLLSPMWRAFPGKLHQNAFLVDTTYSLIEKALGNFSR